MARIPAHEIEQTIIDTMHNKTIEILALDQMDDHALIEHINAHMPPPEKLLRASINKIIIDQDKLHIDVNIPELHQYLQNHLDLNIPVRNVKSSHVLVTHFTTRRSYKGAVILKATTPDHDFLDLPPHELRNLVKGTIWREEHFNGMTLFAIAKRDGFSKQHVHQVILKSMETS